jgi:hypothetical protein
MLKMTFLECLYHKMENKSISQCLFSYTFKHIKFSIIFDIETNPFCLLFGVLKDNLFFSFEVDKCFVIKYTKLENATYIKLVNILKLQYDPNNKFSPYAFLDTFNKNASVSIDDMRQAEYYDRAPFFSDVEESDKVFFQKWLVHQGERKVTEMNLEKTRKWLGESAYQNCKNRNISSCWTADKTESQKPSKIPE